MFSAHRHKVFAGIGFTLGLSIFLFGAMLNALASLEKGNVPTPKPRAFIVGDALYHSQPTMTSADADRYLSASEIINAKDLKLYQQIFAAQDKGEWSAANKLMDRVQDDLLMGHVLYQRYMHPNAYVANYTELYNWLTQYRDMPGAENIYRLANIRYNGEVQTPPRPGASYGTRGGLHVTGGKKVQPVPHVQYSKKQKSHYSDLKKQVYGHLSKGRPTAAVKALRKDFNKKVLAAQDYDRMLADIAQSFFLHGKPKPALEYAHIAYARSGRVVPLSGWVAGLASWQLKKPKQAAIYFEKTALSPHTLPDLAAASAYWAYRAHAKTRDKASANNFLTIAARYPYSFYGVIAHQQRYGQAYGYSWEPTDFADMHMQALEQLAGGKRAIALLKMGLVTLAEKELKSIDFAGNYALEQAVVSFSNHWDMPALSLQTASAVKDADGSLMDPALYPLLPWEPKGGFIIDKALVKAFVKQESRFNPKAKSPSGAIGLMQLMPQTASYVSGEGRNTYKTAQGRARLMTPSHNLMLGQKYLTMLMADKNIEGDLIKTAVAYNAGPNRMARWADEIGYDDPLFFIERIPSLETRMFVEHILSNLWVYRSRLNQPAPSLARLIENGQPIYQALDARGRLEIAAND